MKRDKNLTERTRRQAALGPGPGPGTGQPSASQMVALSPLLPPGLQVLPAALLSVRLLHRLCGPALSAYSGLCCSFIILACVCLSL